MKTGRVVLSVLLIALCCIGWFRVVVSGFAEKKGVEADIEMARKYTKDHLYQKAIESYSTALKLEPDKEIWKELLAVCQKAYGDSVITKRQCQSQMEAACVAYPDEESFWVMYVEFLSEAGSLREANKTIAKAERNKLTGEKWRELRNSIRYSYTTAAKTYTDVYISPNGNAVVSNGELWGVNDSKGDEIEKCTYQYVSPYSDSGFIAYFDDNTGRLFDGKRVVQTILPSEYCPLKAAGSGIVPVRMNNVWKLYNYIDSSFIGDVYEDTSSVQYDKIAVYSNQVWRFIDSTGQEKDGNSFIQIRLHDNGDYCYKKIMVAKTTEGWGIFDSNGKQKISFEAKDADVYLGGYIAFQSNDGNWGFINTKGKIVIEPLYKSARSFSNGLAAVFDGESWGFINEKGEVVIGYQYNDVKPFSENGVCYVSNMEGQFFEIKLRFPEDI